MGDESPASKCLFQVELRVELAAGQLCAYPNVFGFRDAEDATLSLLYGDSPVRAVGHGCDAVAKDTPFGHTVKTQALPIAEVRATSTITRDSDDNEISVGMRALADWDDIAISSIEHLVKSYGAWIRDQHALVTALPKQPAKTANRHLAQCEMFLSDIREGWEMAKSNADVRQCLQWTSLAMAEQQRSYQAATRTITQTEAGLRIAPPTRTLVNEPVWRGFQIAFLLASIGPAIDSTHPRRTSLDVIWMPTGGGKTEAYLGLAAFTILWRRLNSEDKDGYKVGDTTILMRYTLRLLTAQQLQRTASLICALEYIRKTETPRLGKRRFTVGAWLGSTSTPNTHDGEYGAVKRLNKYMKSKRGDRPFLLSRCPWCACQFVDDAKNVYGYDVQSLETGGTRMRAKCPDPDCLFSIKQDGKGAGLPVYEVDKDLYERPPTFIIATVDKFAMLAWRDDPRAFFGIGRDGKRTRVGPDLVIQDELHLITGPLGSLVGLYEAGIAALCTHDDGQVPQFVAATATTRAYEPQAKKVFGVQDVRLVPPPALSITDSFFSHVDETTPPRVHVGICATGLGQFTHTQARVFASLAHAVGSLSRTDDQGADYYWSNLAFFGSLRDLGTAKSLLTTDIGAYQWNLVRATGVNSGQTKNGKQRPRRYLQPIELTGNSSQSASENLERLERSSKEKGCVDLALATSVIEVGVDISRLGLLTIVRQPKTVGTYIQVSGRVGRRAKDGPGLVVVILNPQAGRDTSHYERFTAFHDRLYETVEPATVTPFTDASLERGIRGVVASVVRQLRPAGDTVVSAEDAERAQAIVEYLGNRAATLENLAAATRVRERWQFAASQLDAARSESLPWGTAFGRSRQFLHIAGDSRDEDLETASWSVLTSLRNVDATAGTRISADWIRTTPGVAPSVVGLTEEPALDRHAEAEW
jgi:hypothetical protein